MPGRRGGGRPSGPKGPKVGAIVTGTVVGEAKRGVMVELGAVEILLPRARYGAAVDVIEGAGYGTPLTVEVVADPGRPGGTGLSRVGIERSLRQPRPIAGRIERSGGALSLVPSDGSPAFPVVLLDVAQPESLVGTEREWQVGAPYRDRRFVLADPHA